jgi:hypothetical protein
MSTYTPPPNPSHAQKTYLDIYTGKEEPLTYRFSEEIPTKRWYVPDRLRWPNEDDCYIRNVVFIGPTEREMVVSTHRENHYALFYGEIVTVHENGRTTIVGHYFAGCRNYTYRQAVKRWGNPRHYDPKRAALFLAAVEKHHASLPAKPAPAKVPKKAKPVKEETRLVPVYVTKSGKTITDDDIERMVKQIEKKL